MMENMMKFLTEDQTEEVATESMIDEIDVDDIELDAADESAIFLAAMMDACESEQEFNELVMENAVSLAMFGLIEDPEIVTEAKKIVYKQTKSMNLNREQSKAALRFAKKADSSDWKLYAKYRKAMKEARERIFAKWASKSKTEAKKVLANAGRKASSMPKTEASDKLLEKIAQKNKEYEKEDK